MPPPSKKRRTGGPVERAEEIKFNPEERQEYLTGFHKRKVQRAKHAQEVAEKKAKEEKREQRKKIREERRAELEQAIESHKLQLKIAAGTVEDGGSGSEEDEDGEGWEGIAEPPPVDYEAEYIDEDRYTTVTVEDMDPSRNGLEAKEEDSESGSEDGEGSGKEEAGEEGKTTDTKGGANATKKRIWTKENPNGDTKRRRKKRNFKYESATDRKAGRLKERQRSRKQAKLRREK